MNIFEIRKNKLGMTLVEMVLSLVILGILMTSTMGMVISSNQIFISTSKAAIDKQVGNYSFDFIEKVLRYTTHMSIYNEGTSPNDSNLQSLSLNKTDNTNDSGILMFKRAEDNDPYSLYDNGFYGNRTIQYSVHKVGKKSQHVKLKVTVFREGRAVYSRESVVKCLNLNLVAIGDGANPIVDKSSADSVNQTITFSVDEKLLSGGKNAYSLEFKVSEFMGKYNKIQKAYVADIGKAYTKYISGNYDAEVNPGIRGTTDAYNGRIEAETYAARMNAYTKIVFGDGATPTKYDPDHIENCVNLRAYYQQQINDLLKFDLKSSNAAGFTNGNFTNNIIGTTSYKLHNGDAFYGVVATKEEMYFGFMLNHYDKNGDGSISKAEYPQFEGDSFFKGTSMDAYINNTSNNQMVIMCYFKDNVANDNYRGLVAKTTQDVYSFNGSVSHSAAANGSATKPGASTIQDYSGNNSDVPSGTSYLNTSKVYVYYSDNNYRAGSTNLNYDRSGNIISGYTYPGTAIENYLKNTLGAKNATPSFNVASHISGSDHNDTKNCSYTAPTDLTEGWYYSKVPYYSAGAANTKYCFCLFYLQAIDQTEEADGQEIVLNPNKIAIFRGGKINYSFANSSGVLETIYYKLGSFTYDQAQFTVSHEAQGGNTTSTDFLEYTAHQYIDYALYGTDWNSWFNANPSGLINQLANVITNFVNTIRGKAINKNITSISTENAVQSLGNIGQHNISTAMDNQAASYNLAWCVYSPKRGTWYYLPARSTRLSGLASSFSFSSKKDAPTPLDADLDDGSWKSSSAMVSDIEMRKLSSNGLFGLVDTTSDVLWVALPTGNTIDLDTVTG